jgi:hypothetical protein
VKIVGLRPRLSAPLMQSPSKKRQKRNAREKEGTNLPNRRVIDGIHYGYHEIRVSSPRSLISDGPVPAEEEYGGPKYIPR